MGLKECWANLDKKDAFKTTLLALVLVSTSFGAFQSYKLTNYVVGDTPAPAASAPSKASADQPSKKPSEYKIGIPYEKASKDTKKPMIVLFYADWCGFCVRFMPIYEELYKNHKNQFNFTKVNVEDSKYADAVQKYEISAFPTVYMVNTKEDTREHLENQNFGDMKKLDELLNDFHKHNK